METIAQLEEKIEALIGNFSNVRKQNEDMSRELSVRDERIRELEEQNAGLRQEIESLQETSSDRQNVLDSAAQRVQNLIEKLESIQ
jgi:uncharacterized coiled-coil protein SlyX